MKKLLTNGQILTEQNEKVIFGKGLNESSVNESYSIELNEKVFKVLQYWKSQKNGIDKGKPKTQSDGAETANVTTIKIEWEDGKTEVWTTETIKKKFCPNRVKAEYDRNNNAKPKVLTEEFKKLIPLAEKSSNTEIESVIKSLQRILQEREEAEKAKENEENEKAAKRLGFESYEDFLKFQKRQNKKK